MLNLFEDHLKRVASDPADDFHFQMRSRVGKRATLGLEKRLRNLILLMPKLLSQTYQHCSRCEVPSEIKKVAGFTLTYFYHPSDVLPGMKDKLFGYLDDAYFVALAYEKILRSLLKRRDVKLSEFDLIFLKNFPLFRKSVEGVIPKEAGTISKMISELSMEKQDAFYAAVA